MVEDAAGGDKGESHLVSCITPCPTRVGDAQVHSKKEVYTTPVVEGVKCDTRLVRRSLAWLLESGFPQAAGQQPAGPEP